MSLCSRLLDQLADEIEAADLLDADQFASWQRKLVVIADLQPALLRLPSFQQVKNWMKEGSPPGVSFQWVVLDLRAFAMSV